MAVDSELLRREALYKSAEEAILVGGQAVTVDGISYTKGDLGKIQAELKRTQSLIKHQMYGGSSNRARFGDRG